MNEKVRIEPPAYSTFIIRKFILISNVCLKSEYFLWMIFTFSKAVFQQFFFLFHSIITPFDLFVCIKKSSIRKPNSMQLAATKRENVKENGRRRSAQGLSVTHYSCSALTSSPLFNRTPFTGDSRDGITAR